MTINNIKTQKRCESRADASENGRILFAQHCEFSASITTLKQLPPASLPEVAFAGRSNVGKSSLINGLTNRKMLARTSSTPGRTRQINFFLLAKRLRLADLPGYGYARAPKAEIRTWTRLVNDYLMGRQSLKRVFLLVDGRHGLKPQDEPIMELLDNSAVSFQAILTKSDKVSAVNRKEIHHSTLSSLNTHPASHPKILFTSAETGEGVQELRAAISTLIET